MKITAILSGDAMLVLAYRLMNNCPDSYLKQVMDIFSQTALEICEGSSGIWNLRHVVMLPYLNILR